MERRHRHFTLSYKLQRRRDSACLLRICPTAFLGPLRPSLAECVYYKTSVSHHTIISYVGRRFEESTISEVDDTIRGI